MSTIESYNSARSQMDDLCNQFNWEAAEFKGHPLAVALLQRGMYELVSARDKLIESPDQPNQMFWDDVTDDMAYFSTFLHERGIEQLAKTGPNL
ncbi:MAG: hypothetical protein GC136_07730 [Alphaproteobacteria bacterium]|nr:hypothetical protein [Alphaproteobacteria bacterium]